MSNLDRLNNICKELLSKCYEFFNHKGTSSGAVKWVNFENGELLVFTRSEYRNQIMESIDKINKNPIIYFKDSDIELEQQLKQRDELLKKAIKEIQTSVDYDSLWIEDQGNILICKSEPEYQRYKGHCDFLNKPEIQAIINKEKE